MNELSAGQILQKDVRKVTTGMMVTAGFGADSSVHLLSDEDKLKSITPPDNIDTQQILMYSSPDQSNKGLDDEVIAGSPMVEGERSLT